MSISGKVISIGLEQAGKKLRDISMRFAKPERAFKVAANAVANRLKKHFRDRNQEPNAEGWKKSGFWAQVRDSVQVVGDDVIQINDQRFNLKYYGGVVTPKRGKALAIPLHEEFKGVLPSTFPKDKFFFLPTRSGGDNVGILAEALGDNRIRAAYLLRSKTTHQADDKALPPMNELQAEALRAVQRFFERELAKQL
jgi:hypothetical protein